MWWGKDRLTANVNFSIKVVFLHENNSGGLTWYFTDISIYNEAFNEGFYVAYQKLIF